MRIVEAAEPSYDKGRVFFDSSPFKARWVSHPLAPGGNEFDSIFVCLYQLVFRVAEDCTIRLRVSADERYALRLDDALLGRGPERGQRDFYYFETYDLLLKAGEHRLEAQVHSLGRNRPWAQVSVKHALVILGDGELGKLVSTGVAPWTAARIDAYTPGDARLPHTPTVVGARFRIDAHGLHAPAASVPVVDAGPFVLSSMRMESPSRWQLVPSPLPAMLEKPVRAGTVRRLEGAGTQEAWNALLMSDTPLAVLPNSDLTVLIDLEDYYCVYPRLSVDGGAGASIKLEFAEALFQADNRTKANRDRIDGLHFVGVGDEFRCDGAPTDFEPLWWIAGRYVQVSIHTADQAVQLKSLGLFETRYPFSWQTQITTTDPAINSFLPITRRAMEMCSHETFCDCPYYEQLMYVGDSRLEALVTYAFSADDRLPLKAITLFDRSRTPDGWTQSRTPSRMLQVIPPFSWWWVGMVHDLAMWRDRPAEVARSMNGVRAVMETAYQQIGRDGLYQPTTGWNFVDWVPGWNAGMPPNNSNGPLAPLHFHVAYTAGLAAELETIAGEPLLAQRHREKRDQLNAAGRFSFLDPKLNLFADDREHQHHSEHAQCLALLAGAVEANEREAFASALAGPNNLARTTIYFSHYLFEAYRSLGRIDAMFDRLKLWTGLKAGGFRTTPESPEPSRSDCHAWGAHPMYHLYASVLGVRPGSAGFKTVEIAPQLGPLDSIGGTLVHPRGEIRISVQRTVDQLKVSVDLPSGVAGTVWANGKQSTITAK
jgi:alpha-L-rhamnosidase